MALRKLKDLIREMIFENSAHEHEYANVMATLVFNRNNGDTYDKAIEDAEENSKRYDARIQKINNAIELKDAKINAQKSAKEKTPAEEFRAAMARLNKQKGILKNLQQMTIAEKIQHGFSSLDPVIKKYACLRYIANECVKNENFKTEKKPGDIFLYADEHEFKSSQMARNFREISDFADYIFGGSLAAKITEPSSMVQIIKNIAKELDIPFGELTADNIVNVYNGLLTRIAEENNKKQSEAEQIEQSQIGIKPVQDFGKGLVMYRLMPDTDYYNEHQEHRNLVYEGNQMGICIGKKEQSYSTKILKEKDNQYYSLRERKPNGQLVPHCTIEVNGNVITQVKGNSNGLVNADYIIPVRQFLKEQLNCAFPDDKAQGKRQLYDYSNIGFIKDKNDKTVDIFNLPENTEFSWMPYDLLMTKGANIKHISKIDTVSFANKKIKQADLDKIKPMKFVKGFDLRRAILVGDLDFNFSGVEELDLFRTDLSKVTSIKFNPNAKKIDLTETTGLHGDFDFSGFEDLNLMFADLSKVTSIKFTNVKKINLTYATGLHGDLDFSGVEDLKLRGTDLSKVTSIKFTNAKKIYLNSVNGLHGDLDFNFSGAEYLDLENADLSKVASIKFTNAKKIYLQYAKGLHGDLDFSGVENLYLYDADLSKVTSIKFTNVKKIDLTYATDLHGDLDFSGVGLLDLRCADLSKVTSIKFTNAKKIYLNSVNGLHGDIDFSGVEELDLGGTDLSKVTSIKFTNVKKIDLNGAKDLHGDLDFNFSGAEYLDLENADLSKVTSIKFTNAKKIYLQYAKGLHGDIDFSGVEELDLGGTDLSKVTSIKFNPNGKIYGIPKKEIIKLKTKNLGQKIKDKLTGLFTKSSQGNDDASMG